MQEYELSIGKRSPHKPWYKSKKWWMSMLALFIPVVNRVFGLDLDVAEIVTVAAPVIVYVIVEGYTDGKCGEGK